MASSVDRAMAKAAAALLPGLLPTPPRSTAVPCLIILPSSFASRPKPGRADSVERWDAHKNEKKPRSPVSSCGSSSPGRGSSCDRWDVNKKMSGGSSSSTSSSSTSSRGSSEKWDRNKRSPSRASSADRWDTHKKARSAQADAQSRTGEQEEQDISGKRPGKEPAMFSGSSYFASPEPSMLPMPAFFRSPGHGMMPVPAQ